MRPSRDGIATYAQVVNVDHSPADGHQLEFIEREEGAEKLHRNDGGEALLQRLQLQRELFETVLLNKLDKLRAIVPGHVLLSASFA